MVKPEKFDHLQSVYYFTVPLHKNNNKIRVSEALPATLLKKETLAQVFSSEFCEISKKNFFTEHPCATLLGFLSPEIVPLWIASHKPRSVQQRCSRKKSVLKNFAIFTGKHQCWSIFLILLKRDSNTGVFLWILQNFQEHLFWGISANGSPINSWTLTTLSNWLFQQFS